MKKLSEVIEKYTNEIRSITSEIKQIKTCMATMEWADLCEARDSVFALAHRRDAIKIMLLDLKQVKEIN